MSRALPAAAVLAAAFVLAAPSSAAAPNYIVVSGPAIARPIVLGNWPENARLLLAIANASFSHGVPLVGRPRLLLAEFWGWSGKPRPSSPRFANQRGWFYPAHGDEPAVFELKVDGTARPRVAPRAALGVLARYGVPIRR
jgi:hypothetical protein